MRASARFRRWGLTFVAEESGGYGLGRPATDEEIRVWNMDVSPTGEGLPPGRGTVKQGAQVYAEKCAACHGPTGIEGPKDKLVGGQNTLASSKPIRTIGSYWPYATTLYDYIHRAMPFNAPQSLTSDETYSVIAWLLFQNQVIAEDTVIDSETLPTSKCRIETVHSRPTARYSVAVEETRGVASCFYDDVA